MMADRVQELMQRVDDDPLVALVRKNQPDGEWNLFLVGGTIRDLFIGRPLVDRDFVVEGDACEFARSLAASIGASYVPLEEQWDMVRLVIAQKGKGGQTHCMHLDFSGLRGTTVQEDLLHRDFTINAMAVHLPKDVCLPPGPLLDPTEGLNDLEKGIIRAVRHENLVADPLRLLRAFRFSCSLGFTIHQDTKKAVALHAQKIRTSAGERIRDELMKLLESPFSCSSMSEMDSIGVLGEVFPELPELKGVDQGTHHSHDAWNHSLATLHSLDSLAGRGYADLCPWDLAIRNDLGKHPQTLPLLKLAALFHDLGKPSTRSIGDDHQVHFYGHEQRGAQYVLQIAKRLRLSRTQQNALYTWVRFHTWPLQLHLAASRNRLGQRAKVRFFRKMGAHAIGTLILAIADEAAKSMPNTSGGHASPLIAFVKSLFGLYYAKDAAGIRTPPLITGHDLIRHFGLTPGPQIGGLLEAVHEARVEGKVCTRQDALAFVTTLLNQG